MSTFSSTGECRKEQLKKLTDLMATCCSLENKRAMTKAALVDVRKVLKGSSDSEAGNNEETDGPNLNVHEVRIDNSLTVL
jgi:hypothetical protein